MEEEIKEIKKIILMMNSLDNEIFYLSKIITKYEKEREKIEIRIDNYTFNIRDRINYLNRQKEMFQDKINSLKLSKKKLKQKIMITMFIILCTTVTVVSKNPASIIFLLSSLGGIASITWNALSDIKIQKDLKSYNLEQINSELEKENNNLKKKHNNTFKNLVERKQIVTNEESILRRTILEKKKEYIHLKTEKEKKSRELLEAIENEANLSSGEIEGQLEIPGFRRIKNR